VHWFAMLEVTCSRQELGGTAELNFPDHSIIPMWHYSLQELIVVCIVHCINWLRNSSLVTSKGHEIKYLTK